MTARQVATLSRIISRLEALQQTLAPGDRAKEDVADAKSHLIDALRKA